MVLDDYIEARSAGLLIFCRRFPGQQVVSRTFAQSFGHGVVEPVRIKVRTPSGLVGQSLQRFLWGLAFGQTPAGRSRPKIRILVSGSVNTGSEKIRTRIERIDHGADAGRLAGQAFHDVAAARSLVVHDKAVRDEKHDLAPRQWPGRANQTLKSR